MSDDHDPTTVVIDLTGGEVSIDLTGEESEVGKVSIDLTGEKSEVDSDSEDTFSRSASEKQSASKGGAAAPAAASNRTKHTYRVLSQNGEENVLPARKKQVSGEGAAAGVAASNCTKHRVPSQEGDEAVSEAMEEWDKRRSLKQLKECLQNSKNVTVQDSVVKGAGLGLHSTVDIESGTVVAVLSSGPISKHTTERCVAVPGGYQEWRTADKKMPLWCAGGAANECEESHPINAVIKPLTCTNSRKEQETITVLISCADIPANTEIFTFYGDGKWPHREQSKRA